MLTVHFATCLLRRGCTVSCAAPAWIPSVQQHKVGKLSLSQGDDWSCTICTNKLLAILTSLCNTVYYCRHLHHQHSQQAAESNCLCLLQVCAVCLPSSGRHRVCSLHHLVPCGFADHHSAHDHCCHQPQDTAPPAYLPIRDCVK